MVVNRHGPGGTPKTAAEMLASRVDYLAYNYGDEHPFTVAARAGDIETFRRLAAHVTEMMDAAIVDIIDTH